MAHSPFQITWALDSNVVACSPLAAQALLNAALHTQLWGWDIAHASQHAQVRLLIYANLFTMYLLWLYSPYLRTPCTLTTSTSSSGGATRPPR
eukprot:scaffold65755_cov61-Phaeocystis_antarctica.AAC.4